MSKAFSVQFIVCAVEREVNYFTACANIFVLLWLGFLNHLVTESQEKPEYMQTRDQNCVLVLIRDRNGSSSSKKELCWSRCKIVAYGEEICRVVKEEKHQFKPFSSMSSSLCSQYHLVYKALSFRGAVKKGT